MKQPSQRGRNEFPVLEYLAYIKKLLCQHNFLRADFDDHFQNCVIKVMLTKPESLPQKYREKAWLRTLVRNYVCDAARIENMRKMSRFFSVDSVGGCDIEEQCCEFPAPDKWVEPDVMPAICRAAERLPEAFHDSVVLWLDGFSYNEIAEITDIGLGTVKSRIARGRNKLADELSAYWN